MSKKVIEVNGGFKIKTFDAKGGSLGVSEETYPTLTEAIKASGATKRKPVAVDLSPETEAEMEEEGEVVEEPKAPAKRKPAKRKPAKRKA